MKFKKFDANSDGMLDEQELKAAKEQMKEKHSMKKDQMGGKKM